MVVQKIFGVERDLDIPRAIAPSEKEQEAMDEVLEGSEHGWFDSTYGGAKLHYRRWLPPEGTKVRAVVVYMHGVQGHGGNGWILDEDAEDGKGGRRRRQVKKNMALVTDAYLKEGYALYAFDQYGHGFSEGERFWIPETWENNLQDYINFVNLAASMHDENIPFFLQGESYGGCLTIHVAKRFQDDPSAGPKNFDSIILTCPAIIGDLPPYPVYFLLRYVFAPLFPRTSPPFMPNTLGPERIWRDSRVREMHLSSRMVEMKVDGGGAKFLLGTALNLLLALEECRRIIPSLKVPFFVAHGTSDYGVPIAGSEFLWNNAKTPESDRDFERIEGGYHDLLGDLGAEKVMQLCVDWTRKRLGAK